MVLGPTKCFWVWNVVSMIVVVSSSHQQIFFPGEEIGDVLIDLHVGSPCKAAHDVPGTCINSQDSCLELLQTDEIKICSTSTQIVICCPSKKRNIELRRESICSDPNTKIDCKLQANCGKSRRGSQTYFDKLINDQKDSFYEETRSYPAYHLNETANELEKKGFNVTVIEMRNDAIWNMTYTNGTFTGSDGFYRRTNYAYKVGGKPAPTAMAYFTTLIGERVGGRKDNWVCDGVLISWQWVLSAAHCFIEPGLNPNVVRLGDYDWSRDDEKNGQFVPYDSTIADIVLHPKFMGNERYYDLALVQMTKPYPMYKPNISPICLPWGDQTNINLVGHRNISSSGWGATSFNAITSTKTPILQNVELEIFDVSVCEKGYSKLLDFTFKWPRGMTKDKTLCAGWEAGGRDSCKGDSGGPLTYKNGDISFGDYTLAGIVSGGHGCGLKEYPGIYIPINNYENLVWIKDIAFKGFKKYDLDPSPNIIPELKE